MRLSDLIRSLEVFDKDLKVVYDFGYFRPHDLDSSRGDYSELALGYTEEGDITVKELLELLKGAIGRTYTGYKGGEFLMNEHTPVCIDNWGHWSETEIVAVQGSHRVTIITRRG